MRQLSTRELQIPSDYISIPFELPEQRYVGLLACQINPLLKRLDTKVISCQKAEPLALKTNASKKAAKASKGTEKEEYEIQFADSCFFPEGGGQLNDQGTVTSEGSQPVKIHNVVRKGLQAIHYADAPLPVGASVHQEVDWERRWDLMLQHTGQHLLSAVLEEYYDNDTLGWSLQPFPEPSYIELPRQPTPEEIVTANKICNLAIAEGADIRVEVSLPQDPDSEENRPSTLPKDYRGGVVRCVSIYSSYVHDKNYCCGTHTSNLSHIQSLYILPNTTPIRGTNVRLYFLVGPRVNHVLGKSLESVRLSALELGCASDDLVDRLKTTLSSHRDISKRERKAKEELAGFLASALVKEASEKGGKAMLVRTDEELEFLSIISARLADEAAKENVYILASSNSTGSSALIITGDAAKVATLAGVLKESFGSRLKGGGKGRYQGKLEGKINKAEIELLEKALEQV